LGVDVGRAALACGDVELSELPPVRRKLGFNPLLSFIAIPVIHGTFSWWSSPSWIPDPFLRIWMQNIHK
jgi:hypothetical protein